MSWQTEYLARYEERLRQEFTADGRKRSRLDLLPDIGITTQQRAEIAITVARAKHSAENMPKIAYSAEEIASLTGLSVQFIRNDLYAGRLPSQKYGRRRLVKAHDLDEYLERGSEGTKAKNTREICGND